jgi:hypothetical protein
MDENLAESTFNFTEEVELFTQQPVVYRELREMIFAKIETPVLSLEQWKDKLSKFDIGFHSRILLDGYLKTHQLSLISEKAYFIMVFLKNWQTKKVSRVMEEAEIIGLSKIPVEVIPFLPEIPRNYFVIITADIHCEYLLGIRREDRQVFLESYYKDHNNPWPAKAVFAFVWPN